jgi:lipopolysaccharide transport system ATP-binding protein
MDTAIKVENLSKIYRLGEIGTGTLNKDIERFVKTKIFKKEDPFLTIGEVNDKETKGKSDFVYSLKDINFDIKQGDAVGIIGRNGAGKSTLLKVLSRVTTPTSGKINIKGRVASLLEVGTGFHPELTGRENIYLNGAILGMRKKEIDRKFNEIVDFSGVERYIDTPVKRYSSGMYVRLAFAVAAHLESEILIVDEVLAVGDAEFQKKCLGKMSDVSKGEGRTVLFVSHNLPSIRRLCNNCIYLENGQLNSQGSTDEILKLYNEKDLKFNEFKVEINDLNAHKIAGFSISEISLENSRGQILDNINTDHDIYIHIKTQVSKENIRIGLTLILKDLNDNIVFSSINNSNGFFEKIRNSDENIESICIIPKNLLNDEVYRLSILIYNANYSNSYLLENIMSFQIDDGRSGRGNFEGKIVGIIRPELQWLIQ